MFATGLEQGEEVILVDGEVGVFWVKQGDLCERKMVLKQRSVDVGEKAKILGGLSAELRLRKQVEKIVAKGQEEEKDEGSEKEWFHSSKYT